MSNKYNLVGKTFGRLTVTSDAGTKNRIKYWNCVCECGETTTARTNSLVAGKKRSCGCLMRETQKSTTRKVEMTGKRYGRITVISEVPERSQCGEINYLCRCDCGTEVVIVGTSLRNGSTRSCGCLLSDSTKDRSTTHGLSSDPLYRIWDGMKQRCHNSKNKAYKHYGARGIFVCEEWLNDAEAFIKWAKANGWAKGLDIDRRDNDKGYSPDNCRFVTHKVNMSNTRNSKSKK